MQTAIPQELSALMTLEQGMRQGGVSPQTPQGAPTVAAQLAGAAQQQMMPPAVKQIVQQAGLAGQIENMRQQQMMQAMQQMAAQQMRGNPMDQGIAAAPGADTARVRLPHHGGRGRDLRLAWRSSQQRLAYHQSR